MDKKQSQRNDDLSLRRRRLIRQAEIKKFEASLAELGLDLAKLVDINIPSKRLLARALESEFVPLDDLSLVCCASPGSAYLIKRHVITAIKRTFIQMRNDNLKGLIVFANKLRDIRSLKTEVKPICRSVSAAILAAHGR